MKYIPAEKLIAEIERRYKEYHSNWKKTRDSYLDGKADALDLLLPFITHLYHEQLEVDFEKELDRIWFDNKLGDYFDNDALDYAHIRTLCKHFYELGRARKEE